MNNNITYESHRDINKNLIFFTTKDSNVLGHFHRSFEILYIIEGSLEAEIGNKKFVANKDDIVFVNKYYTHSYISLGGYKKYVMIVPPKICTDFEEIFKDKTLPSLLDDKEFNKTLLPILESLKDKPFNVSSLVKKGYTNVVFGELINHYKLVSIKKNNNIELFVKILDFIDQNYYKEISLESISGEFGYSKYYFSRLFNSFIGQNMNNYINNVRLEQFVKKVKENGCNNIAGIAYECGFNSLPTFYRCFKKVYGVNPKEEFTS